MTLLELLRQELPKRGGWPEGANCITQDSDLRVESATCHPSVAKCDEDGFWFLDSSRIGGFEADTLASDYTTAIITREQYEATDWDGTGLPPVGCECERSWIGDEWQQCEILFTSNQVVVVKLKGSGMEDAYNIGDVTFRPLRTEAERAIDEMVRLSGVSIGAAKILYDAGYRK
jgi:hypothetical protein|nr:MAG TPA: hypothetical protein [Caudoviricetes sp.]